MGGGAQPATREGRSAITIFAQFLRLGCVSFGGPVAHLGYFEETFVRRLRWLDAAHYGDLVALCQFLPGPASSQVGFSIGYLRGGLRGGFAAWAGFTLPSAILMTGIALGAARLSGLGGVVDGLKLAAVAVVANAVIDMARRLAPDWPTRAVGAAVAALLLSVQGPVWQIAGIALGLLVGLLVPGHMPTPHADVAPETAPRSHSLRWLAAFAILLAGLPLAARLWPVGWLALVDVFYRAGSLVFGGGHVVLPLLQSATVGHGWLGGDMFLAGYGAAQAMPGPLFSFAAFLGAASANGPGGVAGGLLALAAIYLPSWLLVPGALPLWQRLRSNAAAAAALRGAGAAVVGLLFAAFVHPVFTGSVTSPLRGVIAAGAFVLLRFARVPPWLIVILCAGAGWLVLR